MDFLASNNLCGQTILRLVSGGNAIIAELQRLADFIPPAFRTQNTIITANYSDLICDFSYFKISLAFEQKIEQNATLQDLDDEFRENNIDLLSRFYLAFECVHKYIVDLNRYLEDLEDGVYIQMSMETVMLDEDGKQLMCEALYLYAVMLLIIDRKIPGSIRECLLVSYYRYSGQKSTHSDSNFDDVCKLFRGTGYVHRSGKRPPNYPEDYFLRVPISSQYLSLVIGRLRSEDVYNQISAYPLPEHRSTAMATQSAMLFLILYFSPNILHNQTSTMREIVDKYFPDNWVISIYMGIIVNLIEAWEPYKAAKMALSNSLESSNIKEQGLKHQKKLSSLNSYLLRLLKEGVITEELLLDDGNKIVNLLRDSNVTLRWFIVHTSTDSLGHENNKRCKQARDQVLLDTKYDSEHVFELLLNVSELELKVKEMYKSMLAKRDMKWTKYKSECVERTTELAEVFSGTKPLSRIEKNSDLEAWFKETSKQISTLNFIELSASGRRIVHLIQALEEVQEFHQLDSNMQVKQFLQETRSLLHHMIRTINLKETVLINLQIVADFAYAWHLIDSYTGIMQSRIQKDPSLVIKLRSMFMKLSSALDLPLLRINLAKSEDFISVSQYYSGELVTYARQVLQIIPETMFKSLDKIVQLRTNQMKEVPTRLDKDKLKEYAQLDERYQVARLTHSISVFTEGIQMMKTTLVGIIKLDPKQLLEDGIRKELVRQVASALHTNLVFNPKSKQASADLEQKLKHLAVIMDSFRTSFEYIQDYVDVYGLKIWQQEVSRIVNFNVEQECNSFLRQKVLEWESSYQSRAIPIPSFPPVDGDTVSINFIGRLSRELLRITDPKTTIFIDSMATWYDAKTHSEQADSRLMSLLHRAIGTAGLAGLDRLFGFMIVTELQKSLKLIANWNRNERLLVEVLEQAGHSLGDDTNVVVQPYKFYSQLATKMPKNMPTFLDIILRVGQLQLLKMQIAHELRVSSKFDSKLYVRALAAMNEAVMKDIFAHYKEPEKKPYPKNDNLLLCELSSHLDWVGINTPLTKIYVATRSIDNLSLFIFVFVIMQLNKLQYGKSIGTLVSKKSSDRLDCVSFAAGVITFLRQFNAEITNSFLKYSGQYLKSFVANSAGVENRADFPSEVENLLAFLDIYCRLSNMPKEKLALFVPDILFGAFKNN